MITPQNQALTPETQINNHTTGFPLVSAGGKGACSSSLRWNNDRRDMDHGDQRFLSISMPMFAHSTAGEPGRQHSEHLKSNCGSIASPEDDQNGGGDQDKPNERIF